MEKRYSRTKYRSVMLVLEMNKWKLEQAYQLICRRSKTCGSICTIHHQAFWHTVDMRQIMEKGPLYFAGVQRRVLFPFSVILCHENGHQMFINLNPRRTKREKTVWYQKLNYCCNWSPAVERWTVASGQSSSVEYEKNQWKEYIDLKIQT